MHKQICMHVEDILTIQIDLQCPLLFCLRHSAALFQKNHKPIMFLTGHLVSNNKTTSMPNHNKFPITFN